MENLSERVQREFKEIKQKYQIPYNMEFQVKTLLKLQEEYDNVKVGSNTTRTRETLLRMIQDLQKYTILKEKPLFQSYPDTYIGMVAKGETSLKVSKEIFSKMLNNEFTLVDTKYGVNWLIGTHYIIANDNIMFLEPLKEDTEFIVHFQ